MTGDGFNSNEIRLALNFGFFFQSLLQEFSGYSLRPERSSAGTAKPSHIPCERGWAVENQAASLISLDKLRWNGMNVKPRYNVKLLKSVIIFPS